MSCPAFPEHGGVESSQTSWTSHKTLRRVATHALLLHAPSARRHEPPSLTGKVTVEARHATRPAARSRSLAASLHPATSSSYGTYRHTPNMAPKRSAPEDEAILANKIQRIEHPLVTSPQQRLPNSDFSGSVKRKLADSKRTGQACDRCKVRCSPDSARTSLLHSTSIGCLRGHRAASRCTRCDST